MTGGLQFVLAGVAVLGAGTLAGVLFSVARAVVPAFAALPADQYMRVHRLLDPRFDPLMPWVGRMTLAATLPLLALAQPAWARAFFVVGAAGTALVVVVSELRNVRVNRILLASDPGHPPRTWQELRRQWGRAHVVRTTCAMVAFAAYICGAVVLR
jgi:uncharacterized membrane protein